MCAIQCDPSLQSHIMGLYAKDTLPTITPGLRAKGVGLIVNTDVRQRDGRHWIAMYFKGKKAELFDSLPEQPVDRVLDRLRTAVHTLGMQNNYNLPVLTFVVCSRCIFYSVNSKLT